MVYTRSFGEWTLTSIRIPFNSPSAAGRELQYMADALAQGSIAGDGSYTKKCHELLSSVLGVPRVFLTTSCTHALEMSAMLLELAPATK